MGRKRTCLTNRIKLELFLVSTRYGTDACHLLGGIRAGIEGALKEHRSTNGLDISEKPLPLPLSPQVPARRVAANPYRMNMNLPTWVANVSQYFLFSLKGFQSNTFASYFYLKHMHITGCQLMRAQVVRGKREGGCTCSCRLYVFTDDMTVVLVGGLNLGRQTTHRGLSGVHLGRARWLCVLHRQ